MSSRPARQMAEVFAPDAATFSNVHPQIVERVWVNGRGERVTAAYFPAGREKGCRHFHDEQAMLIYRPVPVEPQSISEVPFTPTGMAWPHSSVFAEYQERKRRAAALGASSVWHFHDRRLLEQVAGACLSGDVMALACVLDLVRDLGLEVGDAKARRKVRERHFDRMCELVSRPKTKKDRLTVLGRK